MEGPELFHVIQNYIKKWDCTKLWSLSPPFIRQTGVSHRCTEAALLNHHSLHFSALSWSFPLQATSAPRLSPTLFLFLKFLLLIKSLKTLLQYHHFLVSYSLVNWLILRVILTLSSHWASSDAKAFFQIFLHFIFVPTCTEYKYRTQFCNSGLKMQISSLLGNLIVSITCSELSKAQRVQISKEII